MMRMRPQLGNNIIDELLNTLKALVGIARLGLPLTFVEGGQDGIHSGIARL